LNHRLDREIQLYLQHSFVTRALEAGRPPTDIAGEIADAVETVLRFYAYPTSTHRSAEVCNTRSKEPKPPARIEPATC
jgi:hypothetical protein